MYAESVTERLTFATPIHPQVLNNGDLFSGAIDLGNGHRAFFMLDIGAITAAGSITATLQESADNSSWQTVANVTTGYQLALLTTSSKVHTQEIHAGQLSKGYRYVRLKVTETVGQNVYVCCIAVRADPRFHPGKDDNVTAVGTQNVAA